MAKVKITGHASGTGVITVTAPNTSTDRTITLPDETATLSTFNPDAAVVINESGADVDFRVESDNDVNALFVQGSDGFVGLGTATPTANLHLVSAADNKPTILLENQQAQDADDAPQLIFYCNDDNQSGIADNTELGVIEFRGDEKDGQANSLYAEIVGIAADPGGNHSGAISFRTSSVGTFAEKMLIDDNKITFGVAVVGATDTDTSNTGNVTLDFSAKQNFVLTLTGNTTLVNPSTENVGQSGFIACIQDGTGGRTLTLGTDYESAGGAGITLTSTAAATDLVPYVVVAAGRILLGQPQKNFS